jgi:hypothetical protein
MVFSPRANKINGQKDCLLATGFRRKVNVLRLIVQQATESSVENLGLKAFTIWSIETRAQR